MDLILRSQINGGVLNPVAPMAGPVLMAPASGLDPVIFYDTFTDTDNTAMSAHTPDIGGVNWAIGASSDSNDCRIVDNYARVGFDNEEGQVFVNLGDLVRVTSIEWLADNYAGYDNNPSVIWRVSADGSDYWLAYVEDFDVSIWTYIDGSGWDEKASFSSPDNEDSGPVNFQVTITGEIVEVFREGVSLGTVDMGGEMALNAGFGLYQNGDDSRIDNFKVRGHTISAVNLVTPDGDNIVTPDGDNIVLPIS